MKTNSYALAMILLLVPLAGCTDPFLEARQDEEKGGEDSRPEISGKVSILDVFVESNAAGSSDNNSSGGSQGEVADSILVSAKMSAGSTGVVVSEVSYLITCELENGTMGNVMGTLNESSTTKPDGSPLDSSNLTSGDTFEFIIQLAHCSASVGDELSVNMIVDGGGTTIAELEFDSITVGKSVI